MASLWEWPGNENTTISGYKLLHNLVPSARVTLVQRNENELTRALGTRLTIPQSPIQSPSLAHDWPSSEESEGSGVESDRPESGFWSRPAVNSKRRGQNFTFSSTVTHGGQKHMEEMRR